MQKKGKRIDWELVKRLCHIQCTTKEVCSVMEMSEDFLSEATEQHFKTPFKKLRMEWAESGKASLRRKQWILADKSASMAMFLGKQYLGQTEDYGVNHGGQVIQEVIQYGDQPSKPWKRDEGEDSSVQSEGVSATVS